jgi:hypothetical protein
MTSSLAIGMVNPDHNSSARIAMLTAISPRHQFRYHEEGIYPGDSQEAKIEAL